METISKKTFDELLSEWNGISHGGSMSKEEINDFFKH